MTFFGERREPAVVKHGLLRRYCPAFASKTGKLTHGRVIFLDGYAGAGVYEDGTEASPLILANAAKNAVRDREVGAIFVEKDPEVFAHLETVLAERCPDQPYQALHGDLDDHLDAIIDRCNGSALFAFLDPFGPALSRDRLCEFLNTRKADGSPTDVLLHVSVTSVWRFGSRLTNARRKGNDLSPPDAALMRHLDRFLGGEWWRPEFERAGEDPTDQPDGVYHGQRPADIALGVAQQYSQNLAVDTGYRVVSVPVRRRPHCAPIFTLTLLTRHGDGDWLFADSVGKASLEWEAAWRQAEVTKEGRDGQTNLFEKGEDPLFDKDGYERRHWEEWVSIIAANIDGLITRYGTIYLQDHVVDVFGQTWGAGAQAKHVRAAVKRLHHNKRVDHDGKGRRFHCEPMSKPGVSPQQS